MATTAIGYTRNLPVTDPHCLIRRDVEVSPPGPHDLLVEVEAISVNPIDVKQRAHVRPDGFRVLGFDAAGIVREVGEAVTLFGPGDEVYYAGSVNRPGSNQRLQLVDERITGRKPATLSFAEAASLPLNTITAWESVFGHLGLTGDSVGSLLVVGATGGVGSVLLQLAEALLPRVSVIATASDEEGAAWVRGWGAEEVVDHRGDLADQVSAVAPDGVDRVFTAYTRGQVPAYARIVKPWGRIVSVDDDAVDIRPLRSKAISWHWQAMFARSAYQTADLVEQHHLLDRAADLVDRGDLRPMVARTLTPISPDTLREAHGLVEQRRGRGKIVLHGWD